MTAVKQGIGRKVEELRLERGWSMQELAMRSGLALNTVNNIEHRSSGNVKTFAAIARALGVSMSEIWED